MIPKLIALYRAMADHTGPECATVCRVPHSCCNPMYCDLAEEYAQAYEGVTLERTDHSRLKFMGPHGCTVAPHLRPLCTLHTCAVNSFGFKPGDDKWTRKYFEIRDAIESTEYDQSRVE